MTNLSGLKATTLITDDVEDTYYVSPLSRALERWRQGQGISMTLAAALLAEGYDVQALERRHRA